MSLISSGLDPRLATRTQDGPAQPQGADLHLQRLGMDAGDLGDRDLAVQHLPDGGEVHTEFTQRPDQVQTRQRL
jgi:hypothetical protein